MITYRIVRGTLSVGTAGTLGIESGGVMFDFPASGWRAYLNGSDMRSLTEPFEKCSLTVDLEGGGELRGACSVVELGLGEAQVESDCQPEQFVEPTIAEAD
jgi:hypothetical protein